MGGSDDAKDKDGDSTVMVLVSEWLWYGDGVGMRMVIDGDDAEMMKVLSIELGWEWC